MLRLFFTIVIVTASLTAQHFITGYVFDAQTREAVTGVNIQVIGEKRGAATDLDGLFVISRPSNEPARLSISHIAYKADTVHAVFDTRMSINLIPLTGELPPVTVTGNARAKANTGSGGTLSHEEIQTRNIRGETSLGDILDGSFGAIVRVCCALDNRTAVSRLGPSGAYSDVTVDGYPEISGLAAGYRLYSYPVIGIDKLSVRKAQAMP
jgi:hypothetical protein